MITPDQQQSVKDLLDRARTVVVLLGKQPSVEQLAAAGALVQTLRAGGKEVVLAGPEPLTALPNYLTGLETYATSLGNRNLVVSFPYEESAVENVSYHIGEESGKFFLTIKPQAGHKPLDAQEVEFSYAGAEADLIFFIGVSSYDALEELYTANEQFFADTSSISLHTYETEIGQVKLDSSGDAGLCSAMTRLIRDGNLGMTADAATDLLAGIEQATNNFKSLSTTADTLELSAWLMRQGARRVWRGENESVAKSSDGQSFAQVFSKKGNGETKSTKPKAKKSLKDEEPTPGSLDYDPGLTTSSR